MPFGRRRLPSSAKPFPARITHLASTANDLTQTFACNPASQITSVTRSNDLAVYPERRRRRRRRAWTGHADQNDSSTPNGLNQITNICPLGGTCKTVTHDGKGNITGVGTDSYGYSSENFLISGPGGTSLGYDPMGRLYQVTAAATTTSILYDGLDRVAEYNAANAVARRYVHGPGVDEPIVWYEGGGRTDRRFLSSDERGSIIAATDSSGTLLNINTYDEYGVPQTTNLGKFGYTGQAWVPEIGLWYYKARLYRPDIGRFMQTDPIGYEGGPNLYAYVLDDPVNWVDPLGLWLQCVRYGIVTTKDRGGIGTTRSCVAWFDNGVSLFPPNSDGGNGGGGGGARRGGGPREPREGVDHNPTKVTQPEERICNLAQRVAERVADSSADVGNAATDLALVSIGASALAARQGNLPGALLALQISARAGVVATAFGGISAAASVASGNSPRAILNQTTSFLAKKLMPFMPDAARDAITAPLEQEGQRCSR